MTIILLINTIVCPQIHGVGGAVRQLCGAGRAVGQVAMPRLVHTSSQHCCNEETDMQIQRVERLEKCEYPP